MRCARHGKNKIRLQYLCNCITLVAGPEALLYAKRGFGRKFLCDVPVKPRYDGRCSVAGQNRIVTKVMLHGKDRVRDLKEIGILLHMPILGLRYLNTTIELGLWT